MSWARLDDHANEHEKQLDAGGDACWLWACGLMYCNRQPKHKRIGRIPAAAVRTLYAGFTEAQSLRLAEKLVKAGLWEKVEGGYQVHDYGGWNGPALPGGGGTGGPVDPALSAKRAQVGRMGGLVSGQVRRHDGGSQPKQSFASAKQTSEANERSNGEPNSEATLNQDFEPTPRTSARAYAHGVGSGSGSESEEGSAEGATDREPEIAPDANETAQVDRSSGVQEIAPESGFDLALRVWSELWGKAYRQAYQVPLDHGQTGDERILQRVGAMAHARGAQAEAVLRHKVGAYLAKVDGFYVDKQHPLRFLERDWNSWGEPAKRDSGPKEWQDDVGELPSHEQAAKHAEAALRAAGGTSR